MNRDTAWRREGLTEQIIGVFYGVYNELGQGFVESVYELAMVKALREAGMRAEVQKQVTVHFRGEPLCQFRLDLLVDDAVVLELKVGKPSTVHEAQLVNYLRASTYEVGLVLTFGEKPTVRRISCSNARKPHTRPAQARDHPCSSLFRCSSL